MYNISREKTHKRVTRRFFLFFIPTRAIRERVAGGDSYTRRKVRTRTYIRPRAHSVLRSRGSATPFTPRDSSRERNARASSRRQNKSTILPLVHGAFLAGEDRRLDNSTGDTIRKKETKETPSRSTRLDDNLKERERERLI